MPPYLRVAAELREKIANGELLPGEQVPSLDRLAETYRISRTTARRAVQVLMDEGLVVPGHAGAFSSPKDGKAGVTQ